MRLLIVLGLIFFNSCKVMPQKNDMIKISGVRVYKDFQERGYTTAGAYTHFNNMKKNNIAQIIIDNESIEKLEKILIRSEKKKHRPTKFGIRNIFSEMLFADSNNSHIVVITDVGAVYDIFGNVKEERAFITDLTTMIDYKMTNPGDLKWLSDFTERMKTTDENK